MEGGCLVPLILFPTVLKQGCGGGRPSSPQTFPHCVEARVWQSVPGSPQTDVTSTRLRPSRPPHGAATSRTPPASLPTPTPSPTPTPTPTPPVSTTLLSPASDTWTRDHLTQSDCKRSRSYCQLCWGLVRKYMIISIHHTGLECFAVQSKTRNGKILTGSTSKVKTTFLSFFYSKAGKTPSTPFEPPSPSLSRRFSNMYD